jgi:hypothetical protein
MALTYTDIFHSKALQNESKVGFLVLKYMYHLATLHTAKDVRWFFSDGFGAKNAAPKFETIP